MMMSEMDEALIMYIPAISAELIMRIEEMENRAKILRVVLMRGTLL